MFSTPYRGSSVRGPQCGHNRLDRPICLWCTGKLSGGYPVHRARPNTLRGEHRRRSVPKQGRFRRVVAPIKAFHIAMMIAALMCAAAVLGVIVDRTANIMNMPH